MPDHAATASLGRVLIVEEDSQEAEVIALCVSRADATVAGIVPNAAAALLFFQQEEAHLVLLPEEAELDAPGRGLQACLRTWGLPVVQVPSPFSETWLEASVRSSLAPSLTDQPPA
ncbi:hypothetical protein [Teichococcus deserti]|uniref:hypothetical protein n=1 Tax=Teichococcus deserti TaxID=1817963 RepID=UPI0010568C76|nr:hypothetical protein [Pseudoroseomonas deserti]